MCIIINVLLLHAADYCQFAVRHVGNCGHHDQICNEGKQLLFLDLLLSKISVLHS